MSSKIYIILGNQMQGKREPLNVAITGAGGQIAYSLYGLLGNGEVFGTDQEINLRLIEVEACVPILKGVQMEIIDCAFPLIKTIEYGSDPYILFKDVDVVIFLGGYPRKPGMERKDLLQINNQIFRVQGQALDKVAKKTCKSLVVANPANTNALTLAKNAPSIPKRNFSCLTRLDHNRALSQLALKSGRNVSEVKNVIIWGNHSVTQYPDISHATIGDKQASEVINDESWAQSEFLTTVQKRGQAVMEARKNSSVVSAANATKDHLRTWFFGTKEGEFVSMGVYSEKNQYKIDEDLVYSFPVKCKDFEWEYVNGLSINQFSEEKLRLTEKELQEEREESTQQ